MCSSQVKMDRKENPSRYTAAIHHGAGNTGADAGVQAKQMTVCPLQQRLFVLLFGKGRKNGVLVKDK